jgi:hypothetical protein
MKNKAKSLLITFFDIRQTVLTYLILEAKQSIPHAAVTFYGDYVKMCEDFAPNFGDKIAGCCITITHRLIPHFSPGNF